MHNYSPLHWLLRLELILCNPAVRCSVPEKLPVQGKQGSYSPLKLLVSQRKNKSANTSDKYFLVQA